MPEQFTQRGRAARLDTTLGDDQLLLIEVDGVEGLSELFSFRATALAPIDRRIDEDQLLGCPASIAFFDRRQSLETPVRVVRGIVRSLTEVETDERFKWFELEIVPPVWPKSQNRRYRIFESAATADILHDTLGSQAIVANLPANAVRNYFVQYGESDFAFASRLVEEEGLYFYFPPNDDLGRLKIMEDSPAAVKTPPQLRLRFHPKRGADSEPAGVWKWRRRRDLIPASVTLRDRAFQDQGHAAYRHSGVAASILSGNGELGLQQPAMREVDVGEFPSRYAKCHDSISPNGGDEDIDSLRRDLSGRLDRYAAIRTEELVENAVRIDGESDRMELVPGESFFLEGHAEADGAYLVASVRHHLRMGHFVATDDQRTSEIYANSFTVVPQSLRYRTPRRTPRPIVQGHQSATVVGSDGATSSATDDVFTDKYGRVRVRFPWSDAGRNSCWMRVAQASAGKRWGDVRIPRVGDEVVVGFQDGDPDCPLVLGSVFNGHNLPPVPLPDHRYRTGFTSRSNGSGSGSTTTSGSGDSSSDVVSTTDASDDVSDYSSYSGLAIGDEKGKEYLHLRAAGNMLLDTYNNQYFAVHNEQANFVQNSQLNIIGGYRGLDLDAFGLELKWKWLEPYKISFGDDIWNAVPLQMYYYGPSRITANFGVDSELFGQKRCSAACYHQTSASDWSNVASIASVAPVALVPYFALMEMNARWFGRTVGRLDHVSGDSNWVTSKRRFDRIGSSGFVIGGTLSTAMSYCWGVQAYFEWIGRILAGVTDVRDGTAARDAMVILSDLGTYLGNILATLDIYIAELEKMETVAGAGITLVSMEPSLIFSSFQVAEYAALHVLQICVDEAVDLAQLLEQATLLEDYEPDSDVGHADLFYYSNRNFIVDTVGSTYLVAKKNLHCEAGSLVSIFGENIGIQASGSLVLGMQTPMGPFISIGPSGIIIQHSLECSLELTPVGVSINGITVDLGALLAQSRSGLSQSASV